MSGLNCFYWIKFGLAYIRFTMYVLERISLDNLSSYTVHSKQLGSGKSEFAVYIHMCMCMQERGVVPVISDLQCIY